MSWRGCPLCGGLTGVEKLIEVMKVIEEIQVDRLTS